MLFYQVHIPQDFKKNKFAIKFLKIIENGLVIYDQPNEPSVIYVISLIINYMMPSSFKLG